MQHHQRIRNSAAMRPVRFLIFFFLALNVALRAGDLPEGDQHVAALDKEFDTLKSAHTLFVQMVEEGRPVTEVAHALDVLADEFDEFYASLAQFMLWLKVDPNVAAGFSESGRAQIQSLFKRTLPKPPQLDTLMVPYRTDPGVIAAEARITSSHDKFEAFTQQLTAPH